MADPGLNLTYPDVYFRSTGELPVWLALSSWGATRYKLADRLVDDRD